MSQTVVVTGASAGIGRATARLFGERGARVGLLTEPADGTGGSDFGAHGEFGNRAHGHSAQMWVSQHARAAMGVAATAAVLAGVAARRLSGRR